MKPCPCRSHCGSQVSTYTVFVPINAKAFIRIMINDAVRDGDY